MLATPEATALYADRQQGVAKEHWRGLQGLTVSSIGLGTYLGDDTDAADAAYVQAIKKALASGCNLFDTAINYRHQRSERVLGRAIAEAIEEGKARPQEVVVCTKGGYVPFDKALPPDPAEYLHETYVARGLIAPGDLVDDCHCITARYLQDQLERSLRNLQLPAVDVYYVHNPEHALSALQRDEFEGRLREAFAMLEKACDEKRVGRYGVATWNGLRSDPRSQGHVSLERLLALAAEAAGTQQHRFAVVQAPLSLGMTEALTAPTQAVHGEPMPLLKAAQRLGIAVMTSASILQGRLTRGLPPWVAAALGLDTDAARALQFTRSCPGVTTALVGMGKPEHVEQNLALAKRAPSGPDELRMLFEAAARR